MRTQKQRTRQERFAVRLDKAIDNPVPEAASRGRFYVTSDGETIISTTRWAGVQIALESHPEAKVSLVPALPHNPAAVYTCGRRRYRIAH